MYRATVVNPGIGIKGSTFSLLRLWLVILQNFIVMHWKANIFTLKSESEKKKVINFRFSMFVYNTL